jgi:hypothetical protein
MKLLEWLNDHWLFAILLLTMPTFVVIVRVSHDRRIRRQKRKRNNP